jgi:hypothetical protein
MIEPLNTFFGEMPWPPNMEWLRIHQMGVPVASTGILIMIKDWIEREHNSLTWKERLGLYKDMILAQDFVISLGTDVTLDHILAIKLMFPDRQIYWTGTDTEIV